MIVVNEDHKKPSESARIVCQESYS
jgi:hypothetical protein